MRRTQQGFTLIEIVIAFTILALSTVLVVNLVTQAMTLVVVSGFLFSMDVKLTFVVLVGVVPGMVALTLWFHRNSSERYAAARERNDGIGRFAQGTLANTLQNLTNQNVIHQPIAGNHYRIARPERDRCTDVDAHFIGPQKIGDEMTRLVVQCLTLIQEAGFNGKSGRRMRRRLQLDEAPLTDDYGLRITNLIRTCIETLDRDDGHGRRRPVSEPQNRVVGRLDTV